MTSRSVETSSSPEAPVASPVCEKVALYDALTEAQRDALRVLCDVDPGTDGWVETWRRQSTFEPVPRVNHNAANSLHALGLARQQYRNGGMGQQVACATEYGRDVKAAKIQSLRERIETVHSDRSPK